MLFALALCIQALAAPPYTLEETAVPATTSGGYEYTYPGVYKVKAVPGHQVTTATIGISEVAKQNLETAPTVKSPAIIRGAAVPYEEKTGPRARIQRCPALTALTISSAWI